MLLYNTCGEVLLQQRDAFPHLLCPGMWTVPGGHVEPHETPLTCARREMCEEMELVVEPQPWRTFTTWRGHHNEIKVEQHMFVAPLNKPAPTITLHEGQQIAFFTAEAIATMDLAFGFGPILAAYFAR